MNETPEPRLAPPGAGLPAVELAVARLLLALRRWTGNRSAFNAQFQRERQAIRELVNSCPGDSAARRVLIRRPPGLEDSSRHWSVWMTLDHLRIVQTGMGRIIGDLTSGRMPEGAVSTAAVKPGPQVTAEVVNGYEQSCDALRATVASADCLKTPLRYAHPWFGLLDAHGWHALAGVHLGLHRVQIQRIVSELSMRQK